MDFDTLKPYEQLKQLGLRLRHTMNQSRKAVKLQKLTDLEMKGYLIGRIESILAFIKENPTIIIPSTVYSAFWEAVKILALYVGWKDKKMIDLADLSLRDLEKEANVPAMTAGHGYCKRCGRELTAVESVANGIGPICITKGRSR